MCASQPNFLNRFRMKSAFCLSCGEPTWFGSAASIFSQSRISSGLMSASKLRSSEAWSCATGAAGGAAAKAESATRNETVSRRVWRMGASGMGAARDTSKAECARRKKSAPCWDGAPVGEEANEKRSGGALLRCSGETTLQRGGDAGRGKLRPHHEPHQRAEIVHRGETYGV